MTGQPRRRSVKAKSWHGHPSDIHRSELALTDQDRKYLEEAAGFIVVCPVCRCSHPVHKDVLIATLAIEAVAGVREKRSRWPYSRTGTLQLPRTIREGMHPDSVLMWCPCGFEIKQRDLIGPMGRYLMTRQRQFLAGGIYGDK